MIFIIVLSSYWSINLTLKKWSLSEEFKAKYSLCVKIDLNGGKMEKIAFAVVFLIIISYILLMQKLKKDARKYGQADFNLSVASYAPKIKAGQFKVKLLALGADYQSTLKTVNRYAEPKHQEVTVNMIVLTDVDIYTAEDLIYELKYIGADGEVVRGEGNEHN